MRFVVVVLLAAFASAAQAETRLGQLFSDHAVLQRGRPIAVWGTADPGQRVTVSLGRASRAATAGRDGAWRVELPAMAAGGPYRLTARSATGVATADDVLVGDVWLCSGQSNMELQVSRALNGYNDAQAANDIGLRLLTVPHLSGPAPAARFDAEIAWQPATAQTVPDFSAACYYMARDLRRTQRVPVGAINASWGGTPIRAWMDEAGAAATGGEAYAQFDLHRRDPAAANRAFGERWAQWWRRASGDAPGAEPWLDSARLTWSPVPRMTYWETWGDPDFVEFNGMVWMRKRFTLTPREAAQEATLSLGVIDELDQTFFNGVPVGGRFSWEAPRDYRIGPGILHPGENEVVVNVFDGSGFGGLQGPAERIRLVLADGTVKPLGEGWDYSPVPGHPEAPPRTPWDDAMGFTAIYNGMIAPLRDFGLTGVAWYQGESDVGEQGSYADRLAAMMRAWRAQARRPNLPFLIVSLANFGPYATAPTGSGWAELREQQRLAVARDPHAALVVAMDLGERLDIHPANKSELGRRLARGARHLAYGADDPAAPEARRVVRAGDGYVVEFTGVTGALHTWSGTRALAFELCGETQGSCRFADATASAATVRIAGDGRPATRVRYGWADSPVTNLYDEVPLPPGPFELPVD